MDKARMMSEETLAALKRWCAWHYRTHARTPERYAMLLNRKTHEIFEEMITEEIFQRAKAAQEKYDREGGGEWKYDPMASPEEPAGE